MKKLIHLPIAIISLAILVASCTKPLADSEKIENLLTNSAITFERFTADSAFTANFEVQFKQEIVPGIPDSGYFTQRIYLSHKGFDKPMVIITEGYTANNYYLSELAELLDANQLIVEHRYFGKSIPEKCNWQHLTVTNAAADHHAVISYFKKLYKGAWISSGISKGGQTALYHNYFYPTDVQASVPYVAPLNFSDKEPRVFQFLNQVADSASRNKIYAYQQALLSRKSELMPYFIDNAKTNGYTFSIGNDLAYEYSVLEYPFAFWQWGYLNAEQIPAPNAPADSLITHLQNADAVSFFADESFKELQAFFYQALTEIGFYTYDISPFGKLIIHAKEPSFVMSAPKNVKLEYSNNLMLKVNDYLQQNGNNILYIYGEYDPWSAAAVQLVPGKTNALKMVKEAGSHRTRIRSFSPEEQKQMLDSLKHWIEK